MESLLQSSRSKGVAQVQGRLAYLELASNLWREVSAGDAISPLTELHV